MRALATLLPLAALFAGCPDGFGFDATGVLVPVAPEATTSKALTLHLDNDVRQQRFRLPVSVTPAGGGGNGGHVDATFARIARPLRAQLALEGFETTDPLGWNVVDSTSFLSAFTSNGSSDVFVFAVGLDPADPGEPIDFDVALVFGAPSDVDFDGIPDEVAVEMAAVEPLP